MKIWTFWGLTGKFWIIKLFKFFSKPILWRKFFDCKMTWAEDALHLKVWKINFERSFERALWISESKKRHFSDQTEKWGYKLPILWQKMSHKHVIRIWYLNSYLFAKFEQIDASGLKFEIAWGYESSDLWVQNLGHIYVP